MKKTILARVEVSVRPKGLTTPSSQSRAARIPKALGEEFLSYLFAAASSSSAVFHLNNKILVDSFRTMLIIA
jgi:hypothetical protein